MVVVITVIIIVILLVLLTIQIVIYRTLSKCIAKQNEGKIYVMIASKDAIKGWMLSRDLLAIQNNTRSPEEHIRVEGRSQYSLVQIRSISKVTVVSNTIKIILGNL